MKPVRQCVTKSHSGGTASPLTPTASELPGLLGAEHVPWMNKERKKEKKRKKKFLFLCFVFCFAEQRNVTETRKWGW
jgi:hypothetical protein